VAMRSSLSMANTDNNDANLFYFSEEIECFIN
jgi:hypothetical protein